MTKKICTIPYMFNLLKDTSHNSQTYSDNSSAICKFQFPNSCFGKFENSKAYSLMMGLFAKIINEFQLLNSFIFYLGVLSRTYTIHRQSGKGKAIVSLTPLYHFRSLHKHLDINRAITGESSPLHIAGSLTRTGKFWFTSAYL